MAAACHMHFIIEIDNRTNLLLMTVIAMQQLKGLSVPDPYQLLLTTRNNDQKLLRSSDELNSRTLRWKLALIEQFQFEVIILPDFVRIDQVFLSA